MNRPVLPHLSLLLLSVLLCLHVDAQCFDWVRQFGGEGNSVAHALTHDAEGNVYFTGFYGGNLEFEQQSGTHKASQEQSPDCFVIKINAVGELIWARRMSNQGSSMGKAIAVDDSGFVYLAGEYAPDAAFVPNDTGFTISDNGTLDIFLARLDPAGTFLWTKRLGREDDDEVSALALDTQGNIYLAGSYLGASDFDPGPEEFTLISQDYIDGFIAKYDKKGNFLWANPLGGLDRQLVSALAVDKQGAVYAAGSFQNQVDFDPSKDSLILDAGKTSDIFACKYSTEGRLLWARQMGSSAQDRCFDLALDFAQNVYLTGYMEEYPDLYAEPVGQVSDQAAVKNCLVAKLTADGDYVWARPLGSSKSAIGLGITTGTGQKVFISGIFEGRAKLQPGQNDGYLVASGQTDGFILELDAWGKGIWTGHFEAEAKVFPLALSLDPFGNLYTTGKFEGPVDFEPGTANFQVKSKGNFDAFLHKMRTGVALKPGGPDSKVDEIKNEFGESFDVFYALSTQKYMIDLGSTFSGMIQIVHDQSGKMLSFEPFNKAQFLTVELGTEKGCYSVDVMSFAGKVARLSVLKD